MESWGVHATTITPFARQMAHRLFEPIALYSQTAGCVRSICMPLF